MNPSKISLMGLDMVSQNNWFMTEYPAQFLRIFDGAEGVYLSQIS